MRSIEAVPHERVPAIANTVTEQPRRNKKGTCARPLLGEGASRESPNTHREGKDASSRVFLRRSLSWCCSNDRLNAAEHRPSARSVFYITREKLSPASSQRRRKPLGSSREHPATPPEAGCDSPTEPPIPRFRSQACVVRASDNRQARQGSGRTPRFLFLRHAPH